MVDDVPLNLTLVSKMLGHNNFRIRTTSNGLGTDDFITKPIMMEKRINSVATQLKLTDNMPTPRQDSKKR